MLLSLLLTGCPAEPPPKATPPVCDESKEQVDLPSVIPGAPQAGVAESFVDLPVGTPLSGYTSRCGCFGGDGKADRRDSAYTSEFAPSAGVQTRIPIKVFWLTNGDQDLAIIKIDLIYSFDGLVEEMEKRLSSVSGKDMDGKVVVATNHSHSAYGDFSDQVTFYLGSDRFNYEVFTRMADAMEDTATVAYTGMQPVKLGVGFAKDWDGGRVYHDRRGDNDKEQFFPDIPPGEYKDPNLTMLRIDSMDDEPLAVLFDFGMHGTVLGGDNTMISVEAPGHVELAFEEQFDTPVVVAMLQGGAGDASPGGSDDGFARLETVGEYAVEPMMALYESIPMGSDPIRLETASRSIAETHDDIRVTRNGTVDWYYPKYEPDYEPDNKVYADEVRDENGMIVTHGDLLAPFDEFNIDYGEAFCGENPPYLPGYAPADVFPYNQCVKVSQMTNLITGFFDLSKEEAELPLRESRRAAVTATRFGPVHIREADGTETTDDFFIGFLPGEPTAVYTETFRRRAASELGFKHSMAVGYSQDHEGYLLMPEDWLLGGYEADINVWGPLQAEHILEGLLTMSAEHLTTDVVEKQDPCKVYQIPDYGTNSLPTLVPDTSPEAGTLLTENPDYLYSPLWTEQERDADIQPDIVTPSQVARVQGMVPMAWIGGDPGVDFPLVTLEMKDGGGNWSAVLSEAGRTITSGPDILTATTPNPLNPPDATQTHYWYAVWQAVGHSADRAGLPLGTYRLHVMGHTYDGGATTYPWPASEYELTSPEFEVVPGEITVGVNGSDLTATLVAPARGYRLVGMDGNSRGNNPLPDDWATFVFVDSDGVETTASTSGGHSGGVSSFSGVIPAGTVTVRVTDAYGNEGTATVP